MTVKKPLSFILLTLSVLLLITACSPAQTTSEPDLGLEKLTDGVYIDYDRAKFENVSAPPEYYAQSITPDDSGLVSFFSATPKIYDGERKRVFENESEYGYYSSHGTVFYRSKDGMNISIASGYCLNHTGSSVKDLDFMPLSELYKRFEEDMHKFIDNVEIYKMTAITAEQFAETAALIKPSDPEEGWCEPRDVYYIRARQFVTDIPIFTGISPTNVDTLFHNGTTIEACYTKDGLEYLSIIGGYQIGEEKPVNGNFIDLKGAEQIIRDSYTLAYGYDYIIFDECDLVYVAHFEDEKTVLTPAWEFYVDLGPTSWKNGSPWLRINAYTGEFMR